MTFLRTIGAAVGLAMSPALLSQAIPLTISPSTLPNGGVGKLYSAKLTANGSSATQWSFSAGSPPQGFSLSPLQGTSTTISGTPKVGGTYAFTVTAYDPALQQQADQQYSIRIVQFLTPSPLPSGLALASYSQTFSVIYGTAPYTFNIVLATGETFPPGLSLNPAGTLSGVPTSESVGTYHFTVAATDATAVQTVAPFTLTILPPLVFTTSSPLPSGVAGSTYSQTINASGGMSPYTFSITGAAPPGLAMSVSGIYSGIPTAVGTYNFSIQVVDNLQFTATKQFQITIASATPLLQVSPLQLSFSAVTGGDAPPPQAIMIAGNGAGPINFTLQVDGGPSNPNVPGWLTVKPSSGQAPAALIVSVDQTGYPAVSFTARIRIIVPQNSAQGPIDIAVNFNISAAAAKLRVTPVFLRFAGRAQTPATLEQVLVVGNSGGGAPLSITAIALQHSSWIAAVTPGSGQTAPNAPLLLRVGVNTQGLSVGSYHDVIRIASSAGSIDVPVSLFVSNQGAILGLDVVGLLFPARQGHGTTTSKTVKVLNLGDSGSTVNWTADLLSGSDWLTLGSARGSSTATNPGSLALSPNSRAASFPAGGRYSLIRVSDPQALNSPQYLTAVLDIEPATAPPEPDPSPAGLFFTTASGAPPAQAVKVNTSSTAPVAFQAASVTTDGANWLAVNATATASTQTPGAVSVSVNPAGLNAGIYTGAVSIAMGSVLRTVNVTFVVVPAGGCTPSRFVITQSGLAGSFAVLAGWPATLIVHLNDDCGNPVTNGAAVASFSNGDPPLSLIGDRQTGIYSATWQPGIVVPQMTVTVRATSPQLQTATAQPIVQWPGAISQNPANPPTLVPNGELHIFFNAVSAALLGAGLAPGNVTQVYGTFLAPSASSTGAVPLVTEFKGTFMLFGGLQAPLFYVSDQLVNVQVPFELTPNRQYATIVSSNGALTLPQNIDIVPWQPGLAAYADGGVIAQHAADYSLVNAASPARPGENLIVYLAGMGTTSPAVKSGDPTPLTLVPASTQPTVNLDGQNVAIAYAGLTPTGVGLYQINFTVPSNARPGNLDLFVTQGGVSSNTAKLLVGTPLTH